MFGVALNLIGLNIAVSQSTPDKSGLFGATVIFLFNFCDLFQWFLRQGITAESIMISYERAGQIIELES